MKTRFIAMAALLALLTSLVSGCGEDLTAKVLGVWRAAEEGRDRGFIEIAKDKMILDEDREIDIAIEEKDGKVALRRAGTDEVIGVASIVDNDTLELVLTTPMGSTKVQLKRSSKEEMAALYHPPVDKIAGFWRMETKSVAPEDSSYFEIAADSITVNGSKTQGTFATEKGTFLFSYEGRREPQRYSFNKDGKLVRSPGSMSFSQLLVPSSAEEAAAGIQAKRAAIETHLGFWNEVQEYQRGAVKYLELSENSVDDNGKKTAATPVYTEGSVKWYADGANSEFITTRIINGGRLNASRGYFDDDDYERSDRDALEKKNNPKLEHFIGYWLLDNPNAAGFRSVEIGPDFIVRDKMRERVQVKDIATNSITLVHPQPRERFAVTLSHADNGRMALTYRKYGEEGFQYRRVEKSEYDAATAAFADPLAVIPGFWRSEQKVEGNGKGDMVYATAAFALNVRGEKGDAVDWANYHYILFRSLKPRVEEGAFTIVNGLAANPVELFNRYNESKVQIRVTGPDALEISTNGREYLRFVRCTQEEVIEFRKQIEAVY